jgi:diaminopimelate epimerase
MHCQACGAIIRLFAVDPSKTINLTSFSIPFSKMQALGNDFVVVVESELSKTEQGAALAQRWQDIASELAQSLCDRHVGIGADGLILVRDGSPTTLSRARTGALRNIGWIYTNGDGSPSDMCGNGLRCVVLICIKKALVDESRFVIDTAAGPVAAVFEDKDRISIDLGKPQLRAEKIPLSTSPAEHFVQQSLKVRAGAKEQVLKITCVNMGNPHCVIFGDFADARFGDPNLQELAFAIQKNALFPQGVNVEFATALARDKVRVLVWERGCGATLACASGAAATLVAGVLENQLDRSAAIELPGGALSANWSEDSGTVVLTGPARDVFDGQIDLLQFDSLRGLLAAEAIR